TEMQENGTLLRGVVHDENARFLGGVAGNAGVFSTADDLALFLQMLTAEGRLPDGSRYLSAPMVRLALRNHTEGLGQARGLGFYLPRYDDGYTGDLFPKETVGHTGFTGTSFTLDPTEGVYLVLLTNRVCPSRDNPAIYRVRRLIHNAVYAAKD
ncbi:MAG: serine hydrolase, partial [Eubacteriales bacterium]|nr:serine hydrolase [Eubacteriales bacterium]